MQKEWESFMAAADIIDCILEMKRGTAQITEATCDRLLSKIARHLRKHIDCYGDQFVRSKKHFTFDLVDQFRRDKQVTDMFPLERGHIIVKRMAERVENTTTYEKTLLSLVFIDQMRQLNESPFGDGLLGCVAQCHELDGYVAQEMECGALKINSGDIVLSTDMAALVRLCLSKTNRLFVVATQLQWVAALTAQSEAWRESESLCIWPAEHLALPVAWHKAADDWIVLRC